MKIQEEIKKLGRVLSGLRKEQFKEFDEEREERIKIIEELIKDLKEDESLHNR